MRKILMFLTILISISGCVTEYDVETPEGVYQFDVEILSTSTANNLGDSENPIENPLMESPMTLTLQITAKDFNDAVVTDFNDVVKIISSRGEADILDSDGEISPDQNVREFNQGVAIVDIQLINPFGKTLIVAENDTTGAVGTSETIYFEELTIYKIQKPDMTQASPFTGNFVMISSDSLYVLSVSGTGMFIIDMKDDNDKCMLNGELNPNYRGYNTVYIYSRNAPDNYTGDSSVGASEEDFEAVMPGQKLNWFSGNLVEFPNTIANAMTELSFPNWEIPKEEIELSEEELAERVAQLPICELGHDLFPSSRNDTEIIKELEKYEANIVKVQNVKIGNFNPDDDDYKIYSQWDIYPEDGSSNGPKLRVTSRDTVPEFDPVANRNKKVKSITGVLHHVYSDLWVIHVRGPEDIVMEEE